MNSNRLIRFVEDSIATLMDLRAHTPTSREAALARRLAAELRAIAEADDIDAGSDFWRATCRDLVTMATESDPLFFMRWEPIRATMVHGASPVDHRIMVEPPAFFGLARHMGSRPSAQAVRSSATVPANAGDQCHRDRARESFIPLP
jgi:hypothetical protein